MNVEMQLSLKGFNVIVVEQVSKVTFRTVVLIKNFDINFIVKWQIVFSDCGGDFV